MSWAGEEFKEIDLGDVRLNKRTVLLAERMAASPMASIPQACGGWAETQAAYRYLSNDDIDWESIMAPKCACGRTQWCCASRTPRNWTSTDNRLLA